MAAKKTKLKPVLVRTYSAVASLEAAKWSK